MKVAIVLFFAIIGAAQALDWGASVDPIKCYDNTLNPDDTGKEVDCPSGTCLKIQTDVRLSGAIRSCAPLHMTEEKCTENSMAGVTQNECYCNTDLCNSSTVMIGNYAAIMGILAIIYLLK